MTTMTTDDLATFVRDEQLSLWFSLGTALDRAINGAWSMDCADLARRIVRAARLVGPVEPAAVPYTLVAGGVVEAVYAAGNVPVEMPDEMEWQRLDAMMEKYDTTRERCRPRFAATVAAIQSPRESHWINGGDE